MPGLLNPFAYGGGTPPVTVLSAMLADSPWGLWMCDEASGSTLADSSGNSRPMTITGSPTAYGVTGSGATVKGISWPASAAVFAAAATATSAAPGSFTFVSWLYFATAPAATAALLAVDSGSGAGARLTMETSSQGRLSVNNAGTTSVSTATSAVSSSSWHLLAAVCNASALKLRLDGVDIGSATKAPSMSGRTVRIHNTSGATSSGAVVTGPTAYYETTLSDAHIDAILTAGL